MFGLLFRKAPPDSRRSAFARWWSRYAGSIAFVCLILIAALGFARIENARYDGCRGGNLLRQGLREAERQNIATTEATDPSLFPEIPPDVFERLKRESVERSEEHIAVNFANRECGTHIDVPLTGAVIVLPLGE